MYIYVCVLYTWHFLKIAGVSRGGGSVAAISFTQWYWGTGRHKTTEGTRDHQNQQGTRDPPKKNKETAKMSGSPLTKAWAGAKAGARKPPNKSSSLSPWGGKNPHVGGGFSTPLGLNMYTYFKGRLLEKLRKRQIKKTRGKDISFKMTPNRQILDLQA